MRLGCEVGMVEELAMAVNRAAQGSLTLLHGATEVYIVDTMIIQLDITLSLVSLRYH